MQRKERVYEALRSLCVQQLAQRSVQRRHTGFSAEEVAEITEIDRTNASRDLNLLAQEGVVERIPGRPVLFRVQTRTPEIPIKVTEPETPPRIPPTSQIASPAAIRSETAVTSFETLIGYNEGLKVAVQQAKAAILYPPRGLHTLLCGPSGVGKTTLARLMHAFALDLHALVPDAPFVSFNCADYAGNPQLLMAHLFGVVRGAYTGAERDREGLVEQANRGILFLDEVHRLPPEGQEMLFYLMDRERFRRLGDIKERQTSLLLLAATTEDPHTALLPTFRRRIPMVITLPGLNERTIAERYEMVRTFFSAECSSIGNNIHTAPQVLRALLLYDCPGNIGQLRTDVQLICARAYLEYRTNNLSELDVHIDMLPEHIRRSLLHTADMHRTLESLRPQIEEAHTFTPNGCSLDHDPDPAYNLYDSISSEIASLRKSGLHVDEIHQLIQIDIQHYFQRFADSITQERPGTTSYLVDEQIAAISRSIVLLAEERLKRRLPEKLSLVLGLHLASARERIAQGRPLVEPAIRSIRQTHPLEYEVARIALQHLRSEMDLTLPESETDILAILLANVDTLLSTTQPVVGIVIAAHGRGIATSLAELATTLVGASNVLAVELTLEQSPEELLVLVEHSAQRADQGSGILLLVDFTSLRSLGELITQRTGIQTRTIASVSAPLAVEAIRRAQRNRHMTLDQLTSSLGHLQSPGTAQAHMPNDPTSEARAENAPRAILSVCLTGFGSAGKLAELIAEHMPELPQSNIEIICMDINLSGKTEADIQQMIGQRQIIAVVGTINPHLESYPFISLTELLFGDGIARLRTLSGNTLIDPTLLQPGHIILPPTPELTFAQRSELFREITLTLSQRLTFLNPMRILPLIERMIEMIEVEVGETFEIEVLAGLVMHLACVLERGTQQKITVDTAVRERIATHFTRELAICRRTWQTLSSQIARALPEEEPYNIVGILRNVDIFTVN